MVDNKICKKCKIEKNINDFSILEINEKTGKVYFNNKCKECIKEDRKEYRKNNKDKIKENNREYNSRPEVKARKKAKQQTLEVKQYQKQYHLNHKEEASLYNKSPETKNRNNERQKKRRKEDPIYKLRQDISSAVNRALKAFNNKKSMSINYSLPYNSKELMDHVMNHSEKESWMNENNRGLYKIKEWDDNDPSTWKWQIDHIIPIFQLPHSSENDDNFKKAWSLKNLRPLSAKQNNKERHFRSEEQIKEILDRIKKAINK